MNKVLLFGKNFGYSEKNEPIKEKPIFYSEKTLSTQKLSLDLQLEHIREKTNFQIIKLWPALKIFSLNERINLWTILARPLFEALIFPYFAERSSSNIQKVHCLLRRTFKKFCLLSNTIDNVTTDRLMDYNFQDRVAYVVENTRAKWEARKQNLPFSQKMSIKKSKPLVWYPKELQELLNLKTSLCPNCNTRCSSTHLMIFHDIYIPENSTLLENIEKDTELLREQKLKKHEIIKEIGNMLLPFISELKLFLSTK